jgi:hypothetical protein
MHRRKQLTPYQRRHAQSTRITTRTSTL